MFAANTWRKILEVFLYVFYHYIFVEIMHIYLQRKNYICNLGQVLEK